MVDAPNTVLATVICNVISLSIMDSVLDSITVQQARMNPNGQQDLQMWSLIFIGVGMTTGSVVAAVFTQEGRPTYVYGVGALLAFFMIINGACTEIELFRNRYALVKDELTLQYEDE